MPDLIEDDPRLRLLADLGSVWRLSQAVSHARTVDDILPKALDALERTIAPDRSAILLVDEDGVMRFRAWRGLSERYRAAVEGHSPWRLDDPDPKPIVFEDAATATDLVGLWPAIEAEGIRALAFVPLVTRGRVLGKFMLYHDEPHPFTEEEVVVGEAIAAHIAFAIDRQRVELDLERSRELLDVITRGLAHGVTVQDGTGALVYANDVAAAMTGSSSPAAMLASPVTELLGRFEMLDERGDPFPVDRLPGRRVLAGEPRADAIVQVIDRSTGERRWREIKAAQVVDEHGRVAFAVNIMDDLTERKRLEHDLTFQKTLLELQSEATPEGILVVSPEGRIISHNRRFSEMFGTPRSIVGWDDERRIRFVRNLMVDEEAFMRRIRWLYAHPDQEGRDELVLRDGRVIDRFTRPIADATGALLGRAWFFRDVTDRRRAEDEQRFLSEASRILASSLDSEATLREIAAIAVQGVADWCAVHLVEGADVRRLEVAHRDPAMQARAAEMLRRYPTSPTASGLVPEVIRTGQPVVIAEVTDEMLAAAAEDERHLELLRELELASAIVVPLRARDETTGAITFARSSRSRRMSQADLPFFEELARRASSAIENARLYERERSTARVLQESLLPPHLPEIPGVEVASLFLPFGDGVVVGGDFYDLFAIDDRRWLVMIGDVSGHGPRAAALGSSVRHTVRVAALVDETPSRVLEVANRILVDRVDVGEFSTACVVGLEPDGDGFRVVTSSAGHPLPIVIRADGTLETVGAPGVLLGAFDTVSLQDHTARLGHADTLLLFTDGLEERRDGDALFVDHEFARVLRSCVRLSANDTVARLDRALRHFAVGEFADDVAVLAFHVRASAAEPVSATA